MITKQEVAETEEAVLHKLAVYMFVQKYYAGELNKLSNTSWEQLVGLINQEVSFFSNEKMKQGIEILSELKDADIAEMEYEFNRLFVGPKRLEAPPYESVYRNTERAVMQSETLAVRRFYENAGLVLTRKNTDPDDHLALELEFVSYLLSNSVEDEDCYVLYEEFLKKHLFQWVENHCELVREKTENKGIIGISYLLEGLLEVERKQLNVRRRSK
ncbi:molecular chaperone TorD family protein [Bacillus sp. B15-48]|uniref:TorD/DmsD family molecular chaperone n=1 Tax=Bacillus sp. B15-48 TaxID=1548601 RepID=UPI00193F1EC6|nr:molecular chaperone TorD family protein [Bacillus sp. B15-48]